MKILLDTNVLLDALTMREPHFDSAKAVFLAVANEAVEGHITTNSMLDTYYVARKHMPEKAAREAIQNMLDLFSVVSVEHKDCEKALLMEMRDFEDAVLLCCAARSGVDTVVTRDAELCGTQHEGIRIVAPDVLLEMIR